MDEKRRWRVVYTDTESMTGVAPMCPVWEQAGDHQRSETNAVWQDEHGVYDCCPGPHIETWSEMTAARVAELLTAAEAEVCS